MKIKLCPKCKSDKIELYAAGITGNYRCRNCDYVGPLILEKEVDERDLKNKDKNTK